VVLEDWSYLLADRLLDINSELDELDREEFYRLKKVSGKKQRDQAAADAEIRKQREKEAAKGDGGKEQDNEAEATDVLGVNEDDDVIF
jgi:V-type H+-transporting ATPase subunit D